MNQSHHMLALGGCSFKMLKKIKAKLRVGQTIHSGPSLQDYSPRVFKLHPYIQHICIKMCALKYFYIAGLNFFQTKNVNTIRD